MKSLLQFIKPSPRSWIYTRMGKHLLAMLEEMTKSFLSDKHFNNYRTYGHHNEVRWARIYSSTYSGNIRTVTEEALRKVAKETQKIMFFCAMEKTRSFLLNDDDYIRRYWNFETQILHNLSLDRSQFLTEVRIICNVYCYFNIASKSFIESIPLICEVGFAKGLGEVLRKKLVGCINVPDFAQEEPATRDRRHA